MHTLIYDEIYTIDNIDFEKLRNKSILITGATGLVGTFLLGTLKRVHKTHNIKIYTWINRDIPVYMLPLFEDCIIIKGDIVESNTIDKDIRFDYIIHAAGYGQPSKFLKDKDKTLNINTSATTNLLKHLSYGGTFLFISSSEIYSGLCDDNITEDMIGTTGVDHPRSCYIEGKKYGEAICSAYSDKDYNIKIARLCLAYGPGIKWDDNRVINEFIKKGILDDNISLQDHGLATRTYCFITDAVEMLWNITLNGKSNIYNVGGKDVISIRELAELIAHKLGKSVTFPDIDASSVGNPKNVNISCKLYEDEFNKTSYTPLDYGISSTINWIKKLKEYEHNS
jgi:nucleoside-diphosphate-sugar epimerase